MSTGRPFVLDPTGRDIHAEADHLRALGPATQVGLPGGVLAWSINSYEAGKRLPSDPSVSKSALDIQLDGATMPKGDPVTAPTTAWVRALPGWWRR